MTVHKGYKSNFANRQYKLFHRDFLSPEYLQLFVGNAFAYTVWAFSLSNERHLALDFSSLTSIFLPLFRLVSIQVEGQENPTKFLFYRPFVLTCAFRSYRRRRICHLGVPIVANVLLLELLREVGDLLLHSS